jgi:thiosulfate reductase cytochrome b subunit
MNEDQGSIPKTIPHKNWVKSTHWIITLSFLALLFSGFVILMCHPRLYWGEAGNDLTPALFELPVSRNYQHGGWEKATPFYKNNGSPVSASRTYEIFNQNGWGRSLHFLAAWFLVIGGLIYLITGIFSGYFRKYLVPRFRELSFILFREDFLKHLKKNFLPANDGSKYGLLQKYSYMAVIFFLMPLIALTGLTMSPAITAAYPFLLKVFFGAQSARTIHFFAAVLLVIFLLVHVIMIFRSGFKKQMTNMTFGK